MQAFFAIFLDLLSQSRDDRYFENVIHCCFGNDYTVLFHLISFRQSAKDNPGHKNREPFIERLSDGGLPVRGTTKWWIPYMERGGFEDFSNSGNVEKSRKE